MTTTATSKLPLRERLVGLRLLSRRPVPDSDAARTVEWLLDLGVSQQRQQAESDALQATARAIGRTLQGLQQTVQTRLDQVAAQVVELGLAVAREIVGDAMARGLLDPTPMVLHCIRDCVHGTDGADLRVHLHPDDLGPVLDRLASMPELRDLLARSELLPDPGLTRGAVRAETGAGRLRYDPEEAFERMAAAVRSAAAGGVA